MFKAVWKALVRPALFCGALLTAASVMNAQHLLPPVPSRDGEPASPIVQASVTKSETPTNAADELKARIERLEKQNQELMELLKNLQKRETTPISPTLPTALPANSPSTSLNKDDVQKMVNEYLASQDPGKAVGAASGGSEPKHFVVGQNLGFKGVWTTGPGAGGYQPWFETEDKAFRFHSGFRFHPDWVFGAGSDDGVDKGKGGAGPFREAFDLRRARFQMDGWMYEVIDFMVEFDFVQQVSTGTPFLSTGPGTPVKTSPNSVANTFNPVSPTDVWASINHIPIIGGFRVGNVKFPLGLDHLTSSRFLDFMERSSGFDIFYNRANGFEPGFMIFDNTENQRVSWQFSATKPNNSLFDVSVGGGQWRYSGRLTGLPYYEDNGRHMMHLGLGACYIDHLDQGVSNQVGRWLLRNGGNALQNVVGLAQVFGQSQAIINPEFFMNIGPLSIQAEYIASQVNGVTSYNTQLTGGTPVKVSSRNFVSQTAYVQAMYFLTGESRPYGKTAVHGSGAAPTRVVPFRNYFWVPGHDGCANPFSAGAWQVGARYSYADLNDNGINGGTINEVTFGVNWFLNPNMKFQWNYDIGHRSLIGGTSDGYYYGFGMRMAFDF